MILEYTEQESNVKEDRVRGTLNGLCGSLQNLRAALWDMVMVDVFILSTGTGNWQLATETETEIGAERETHRHLGRYSYGSNAYPTLGAYANSSSCYSYSSSLAETLFICHTHERENGLCVPWLQCAPATASKGSTLVRF